MYIFVKLKGQCGQIRMDQKYWGWTYCVTQLLNTLNSLFLQMQDKNNNKYKKISVVYLTYPGQSNLEGQSLYAAEMLTFS
jgi:hypothetical protein